MGAPRLRQDLLACEVVPRPEVGLGRDGSEGWAGVVGIDEGRDRCRIWSGPLDRTDGLK